MNRFFIFLIIVFFSSCDVKQPSQKDLVSTYYRGLQESDFRLVKSVIADSLTLVEGDYVMQYSRVGFYRHFQWDSVFKPVYKVVSLNDVDGQMVSTISVSSPKFKFLMNDTLVSKHEFTFESGKIRHIENKGFIDADWKLWNQQKDTLVNWVKVNRRKLDGLIQDMTKQGAVNYMTAIEQYQKSKVE